MIAPCDHCGASIDPRGLHQHQRGAACLGWWTVDELAADLRVTRRTIWRVLRAIRRELDLQAERHDPARRALSYRLPMVGALISMPRNLVIFRRLGR